MGNGQFSVKGGVIFLNKGGGWLRSDKQYQDFELRLEFRFVEKNANSGIFLRSNDNAGPNKAYQVQAPWTAIPSATSTRVTWQSPP